MTAISFLRPDLLWLLLVVPVLWFWPRRTVRPRAHGTRNPAHAALRSVLIALVILAIATPVRLTKDGLPHQVFIVDLSPSAAPNAFQFAYGALGAIVPGLDPEAPTHLIALGFGVENLGELGDRLATAHVMAQPPELESRLSSALVSAGLLIPAGAGGAITLLSDGLATDRRWNVALQTLTARGIPLHTVPLPAPTDDVRPVAFVAGDTLRVGQTARLLVDLVGANSDVRLQLSGAEGKLAETGTLRLSGRRRVALEFEPKKAGYASLAVTVEVLAGSDTRPANNTITGVFAVQDPTRVLYLGNRVSSGARRLGELLGEGFRIDADRSPSEAATQLDTYDLVVLDDRPAKDMPRDVQKQLVTAVTDAGLGVCMTGGGASFGPGGYHETPLESILPVELVQKEEKKDPSTALAIIIDTSGSMGGNRIVLAKEVTRLALRRLLPHDKIGIVEFYGNKRWAAPLQSAANAIDIQRALNRLDAGGGTILFPAIEEAYYGLRNVQTRYKHVLVLTDAGVESGPYERLLRRMARDGICVSTVLVGPGRHSEFLVELADWGRGRFYNASDRFNLPEIMLKQPSSARLPGYRKGVQIVEARGGRGWWGETVPSEVPAIGGYVETRKRPGADVVLQTLPDRHPVLASWRFGLGRVTALTTEPTGPGTAGWQSWVGYGPFLARVLQRTADEGRLPFRFVLRREDEQLVLSAQRLDRSSSLPAARLDDSASMTFRERAPGLFEARVDWPPQQEARVVASVVGRANANFRLVSAARADVAGEQSVDPARAFDLVAAAKATGGKSMAPVDTTGFVPTTGGGNRPVAVQRLRPLCLLLALLFYLGDLLWRRTRRSGPAGNPA